MQIFDNRNDEKESIFSRRNY